MAQITDIKEIACAETPLLLFDCTLNSGVVHHWSTHSVTIDSIEYEGRVLQHNAFEMKSSADDATDGTSKLSITLANADGYFSPIERTTGWKGAQLTVTFLFYSVASEAPASDSRVVFRGIANAPDESTETGLRLTFNNRLNLTRIYLPETSIQKVCPWIFPATLEQRATALTGGIDGEYSLFYRCGYSADIAGGCGNLNGAAPYASCSGTRAACIERGLFSTDSRQNATARFGGIEFVPPSIIVRTYREKGSHVSRAVENQATYDDCAPLIYGTGWYKPLIVFARNDGNLTRMEALLGAGEISNVLKVVVNDVEIPAGVSGTNMTATGWYNVVSNGGRTGAFNSDFTDANGSPLGDPYGSIAYMSVVVPNAISDGRSLPNIQVLIQGLKLNQYDGNGASTGKAYTNNPAWVLLDVLRRSGWSTADIDIPSFSRAAAACDQPVQTIDLNGNSTQAPRFQCNLILTRPRSASDIVRGIRNGSGLFLNLDPQGRLRVTVEDTIAGQQPEKPGGSNATAPVNGGWPAYEFGDNELSGIALRANGQSSLRVYARTTADSPNKFSVEFQDEFNDYQQDSFTIADTGDRTSIGQTISAVLPTLGIPNFDQAARVAYLCLLRSVHGNTYVDFETSVKSVMLAPGDIITLTYAREGFSRQLLRVVRIAPGTNYRRVAITAQMHDDSWYATANAISSGTGRQQIAQIGAPRPLLGTVLNADGSTQFGVSEAVHIYTDGTSAIALTTSFTLPGKPSNSTASIPLVSLEALYSSTGGSIAGGSTSYYAISGVDSSGNEGALSFAIRATPPVGTNTNCVTIQNLSFSATTSSFNVYRGRTPANLLRIASNVTVDSQFTDSGLSPQLQGPPDANCDHVNFSWRFVQRPEQTADVFSTNTIGFSGAGMQVNEYRGAIARLTSGAGAGQERTVISNTDSTLTVAPGWDILPDATSEFLIADASWHFGSTSTSSPVTFQVPNQAGAIVQISGRAANVHDDECSYELSPWTTWKILGDSGSALDQDVPSQPTFGISATGQGTIEVGAIGFDDLTNTRGITAGTLSLVYLDEISGAAPTSLGTSISSTDSAIALNGASTVQAGDIIQIESELLLVQVVNDSGALLQADRGSYGTTAASHASDVPVYLLARKTFVMPFPRDFFGTPSSGDYSYRVAFPDVRVAAAEFLVTNAHGNSSVSQRAFTETQDGGIRTLSGGQLSLQVSGPLAIQNRAAPPLIIDSAHSVRDIFANVGVAPTGARVDLQVTQDGEIYCQLQIAAGATASNLVNGASLPPLQAQAQLGLDILAVPQTADSLPGADLTVTIRL